MRIVHLTDNMEMGGAERLIAQLCRWQQEQGHDASVCCLYSVGPLGEELRKNGVEVVLLNSSGPGGKPAGVYAQMKQSMPDVVHCHNATPTILGAIAARVAGAKRIIATRHGSVSRPYLVRRELKFAFSSRCCDWVVAVCDEGRRNLMAAPFSARQKIVRIYNATHPAKTNGAIPPAKSGFTLLHVGRLSPAKDQETLLKAFALARAGNPELCLWVVGGGKLRGRLEDLAREIGLNGSVTFFGEQGDVARFLSAADLFVLSSKSEGIPISLLEALAAGVPAVVTDVGGLSEVARLSDATTLVEHSNPTALADAISKLSRHRNLKQEKTAARQCYMSHFTLDRMAREYMSLYNGYAS